MITIDGSVGEGGGQILRTCLALSLLTGQPFKATRVRAQRKVPGLQNQHLVCVRAAAEIGAARIVGATLGSGELEFIPKTVRPGNYRFDIGTAGSTTLVLQTVLPALILAEAPSTLSLSGGTHNPFAPTYDFLTRVFLPVISRMGPQIQLSLERPGYYPKGGGRLTAKIHPVPRLNPIRLEQRGAIKACRANATVAGLPAHIAERELRVIGERLHLESDCLHVCNEPPEYGPGNVVFIEVECEHITEVFTGFGERGVRAETVGARTAKAAHRYVAANVAAATHLADQLLLPMAVAGEGAFTTLRPTPHATTNRDVIQRFLQLRIEFKQVEADAWGVAISS